MKEGNVVQIFGSIRVQDGERTIMILKMVPVDDCNVITTHLLRVIEARLAAQQLAERKYVGNGSTPLSSSLLTTTFANTSESNTSDSGLHPLQLEILKILQAIPADNKVGINRKELLAKFPTHRAAEVK